MRKARSSNVTASVAKDQTQLTTLIQKVYGYKSLSQIRGSPAYFDKMLLELLACVKQLCPFTSSLCQLPIYNGQKLRSYEGILLLQQDTSTTDRTSLLNMFSLATTSLLERSACICTELSFNREVHRMLTWLFG